MFYRFDGVIKKIERKYDEIERALIEDFARSQQYTDIKRMKEIAGILLHFKNYSQCVDAYIEQSQEVIRPSLFHICANKFFDFSECCQLKIFSWAWFLFVKEIMQ